MIRKLTLTLLSLNMFTTQAIIRKHAGKNAAEKMTVALKGEANQTKALIFDLANVISTTNRSSFMRTVGFSTILSYSARERTLPWKIGPIIQERFFAMLNRCDYVQDPRMKRARTPTGEEFPALLDGYQSGKISAANARALIQTTMKKLRHEEFFHNETEAIIIERAALATFTPETFARGQAIIPESAALLKELSELIDERGNKRFKLIALSNWDKESFSLFKELHADVFSCFDMIHISGERGILKPNDGAFKKVLTEHGLAVHQCIFIDDQKENIEAAQRLGIRSHHFTDAKKLRTYLQGVGIVVPETKAALRMAKRSMAMHNRKHRRTRA